MKRDPLRQLERLRQMREERAAAELARRSELLQKAQTSLAEAKEAVAEQAASARQEERRMLAELVGQPVSLGTLYRVHSKLDAFAAKHADLANVAAEQDAAAKDCDEQKNAAHKAWREQQRAAARIDTLIKAWSKREQRRATVLSEAADEDRSSQASPQAAAQRVGRRNGD